MNRKLKIIIFVGCVLTLVNMSIAGISLAADVGHEQTQQSDPIPPVYLVHHADAGEIYSGDIYEPIQFDASGTYTSPTFGAIYEWDFDDETTGYGKYPVHSYSEPGEYIVSLTVTTINDEVFMDDTVVYVDQESDHLVPDGGCHYHADAEEEIEFDASDSVSNDPDNPIDDYIWYFGDGEKEYGEQVTHSYDEERVYYVTLVVKDSSGNTRYDFLHADIGCDYTSIYDLYLNVGDTLETIFDLLFNKFSLPTNFLLNYFDAKIYANYNGNVQYFDLTNLPKDIDVTGNGVDDITIDQLKFLSVKRGPSLFTDDGSQVWFQFESSLSTIDYISSDIIADDDFTICIQFNFGSTIAGYLDLDTPLCRIGYHSPSGEEMPNDASITHIFKPNIIPSLFNFNNYNAESTEQEATSQSTSTSQSSSTSESTSEESTAPAGSVPLGGKGSTQSQEIGEEGTVIDGTEEIGGEQIIGSEEMAMESQEAETLNYIVYTPVGTLDFDDGWYPEYGFRLTSSGGGKFSVVRSFLQSQANDDTGINLKLTFDPEGSETTNMVLKVKKDGGIFHRGLKFETTDAMPTVSVERIENGIVKTEAKTDLFWSGEKIRRIYWGDDGPFVHFESKSNSGLRNFYFNNLNPQIEVNMGELMFTKDGLFELSLKDGLELSGSAGFSVTDLSLDTDGFDAGIIGTLALGIESEVSVGLYKDEDEQGLKFSFNGDLYLTSNCEYYINEFSIVIGGDYTFNAADGEIRFAWGGSKFTIYVDRGPDVEITDFLFEVGDLTLNANYIEIGMTTGSQIEFSWESNEFTIDIVKGPSLEIQYLTFEVGELIVEAELIYVYSEAQFGVYWNIPEKEVKISAGTGTGLDIKNVDIVYGETFDVQFLGEMNIGAEGFIRFKPKLFETGFSGVLNLDCTIVMFEQTINLAGKFTLTTGGSVLFTWDEGEFTIDASNGPSLVVENLEFQVGDLLLTMGNMNIDTTGVITLTWGEELFDIDVSAGASFVIGNFNLEIGQLDIEAFRISTGVNGGLNVVWNSQENMITISAGPGAYVGIEDFDVYYGQDFHLGIDGTLDIAADGYVTVATGLIEAGFSGSVSFGCTFIINEDQVTIGGTFTLDTDGTLSFLWGDTEYKIDVGGGAYLEVADLDFVIGDLNAYGDVIEVGVDGSFLIDWIVQNQVTLSSEGGASLSIENVGLTYGSTFSFDISGALDIDANGYVTLATDSIEASFSGELSLSSGFSFEINDMSIEISGSFDIPSTGVLHVTWEDNFVEAGVTGNLALSIDNFHFNVNDLEVDFTSSDLNAGGNLGLLLDKTLKLFTISGNAGFDLTGFTIKNNGESLCNLEGFDVDGGGQFRVQAGVNPQILFDFEGGMGITNLLIDPPSSWNWLLGEFSVASVTYNGDVYFNLQKNSNSGKIELVELIMAPVDVTITTFYLNMLNSDFIVDFDSLSADGSFSLDLQNSFGQTVALSATGSFDLEALDSKLGTINFDIGSIDADFSGSFNMNLGNSIIPEIVLNGGTSLLATNIDLTIGTWYIKVPNIDISGDGYISATWSETSLTLHLNNNIQWDIEIDTTNLGDWETIGNIQGTVNIIALKSGDTGSIIFDIFSSGIQYNLKVIHDALTFDLGQLSLDPGTLKFQWGKETGTNNPGYFNIINSGVAGSLSAFKLTYDSNPDIVVELLNIDFSSGNTYFTWHRNYGPDDYIEMERYSTLDIDAFTIEWGTKKFTLDVFNLNTGTFRLEWDFSDSVQKKMWIQNTISGLGPGVTYEDISEDLELSANILGFNSNNNVVSLIYYKDSAGPGIYLDSGGANLANYISVSAVKGTKGAKLTLGGLKVDDFQIRKENGVGDYKVTGKIYLLNTLTFSILKNGDWKDLTISWDFNLDGIGHIELQADTGFYNEEYTFKIAGIFLGTKITMTFEQLTSYFYYGWDIDFDGVGFVEVDTNGASLSEIGFRVEKDKSGYYPKWGVFIHGSSFWAENYKVYWDFAQPPGQWVIGTSGEIEGGEIDQLQIAWNGQWYNVWDGGTPT